MELQAYRREDLQNGPPPSVAAERDALGNSSDSHAGALGFSLTLECIPRFGKRRADLDEHARHSPGRPTIEGARPKPILSDSCRIARTPPSQSCRRSAA